MRAIFEDQLYHQEKTSLIPVATLLKFNGRTVHQVLYDRLAHNLTLPVWTIRLQPRRLRDRDHRRGTVDGGGGRVDELRAVKLGHELEEEDGSRDIVLVVR